MYNQDYIAEYSLKSFFKRVGKTVKNRAKQDSRKVKNAAKNLGKKATGAVQETSKTVGEAVGKYTAENVTNPATKGARTGLIKGSLKNPVALAGLSAVGLSSLGGVYAGYRGTKGLYNAVRPKSKAEKNRKKINKKVDKVLNNATVDKALNKFSQQYSLCDYANFNRKKKQQERNRKYATIGAAGTVGTVGLGAAARYGGRELSYRRAKAGLRNTASDSVNNVIRRAKSANNPKIIPTLIKDELKNASGNVGKNVKTVLRGGGKNLLQRDLKGLKKLFKK